MRSWILKEFDAGMILVIISLVIFVEQQFFSIIALDKTFSLKAIATWIQVRNPKRRGGCWWFWDWPSNYNTGSTGL